MMMCEHILGELFYICNLKYPYLSTESHGSLWHRITGLVRDSTDHDATKNIDRQTVPLLFSDPVALLLRILLSLPSSITKGTTILFFLSFLRSFPRILSSNCSSFIQFNLHSIIIYDCYGDEQK